MDAKELEEADSKLVYHDKNGEAVNVIRDKVYRWKGQNVSICILESQSYVDYRMVFRVMLEEAVSYIKQQKKAYKKWVDSGYIFEDDELLSQMRKDEKYTPVITLIVYLGINQEWDGAKTLYEMVEIKEEWKPFVTNHRLNIFDYHDFKDFSIFKTENRIIFELLSCAKDKAKLEKIITKNQYEVDKETAKAILGMLCIKVNLNKIMVKTEKGVRFSMCKAVDDIKESGRREGERETLKKGLEAMITSLKNFSQDIEEIYNTVVANEVYENVTREQIEKLYYTR